MKIKNIIFDLGGVVLNLDQGKTLRAFKRLGLDLDEVNHEHPLFIDFETGKIDEAYFLQSLFTLLKGNASIEQIKNAWNAMLLELPKPRVDYIIALKKNYRLFMLSNTNSTHIEAVYAEHGHEVFKQMFDRQFLSFEMGTRKPMLSIYQQALTEASLKASETVFIDDSKLNIKGAQQAGLHTIWAQEPVDAWLTQALKELAVRSNN
jgi:putative hydrolase of the HAD superfamily